MNSLASFDYGKDFDYSEVKIKDDVIHDVVYGDNIDIKITNEQEFNDGSPTRLEHIGILNISGIDHGPIGLEYLRTSDQGFGKLLLNLDIDTTSGYINSNDQSISITSDELGEFDTVDISGYNFSVIDQNYDILTFDHPKRKRKTPKNSNIILLIGVQIVLERC
jgi:hypothetical protein